jgi:hypothetical protein
MGHAPLPSGLPLPPHASEMEIRLIMAIITAYTLPCDKQQEALGRHIDVALYGIMSEQVRDAHVYRLLDLVRLFPNADIPAPLLGSLCVSLLRAARFGLMGMATAKAVQVMQLCIERKCCPEPPPAVNMVEQTLSATHRLACAYIADNMQKFEDALVPSAEAMDDMLLNVLNTVSHSEYMGGWAFTAIELGVLINNELSYIRAHEFDGDTIK